MFKSLTDVNSLFTGFVLPHQGSTKLTQQRPHLNISRPWSIPQHLFKKQVCSKKCFTASGNK